MEPKRFRIREENMETLQLMYQKGPIMDGTSSEILRQVRALIDITKKRLQYFLMCLFNASAKAIYCASSFKPL